MPWHVSAMKSSQLVFQLAGGHTVSQPPESLPRAGLPAPVVVACDLTAFTTVLAGTVHTDLEIFSAENLAGLVNRSADVRHTKLVGPSCTDVADAGTAGPRAHSGS
jgi:hypothetical protein